MALAVLVCASTVVSAQPSQWSDELPPAERVIEDTSGRTARETAARRIVALQILGGVARSLSAGAPPDAVAATRTREYEQAARKLVQAEAAKVDAGCTGNDCEKHLLPRCSYAYTMEPAMYREVLDRYFSPGWQGTFGARLRSDLWIKAQALPAGTTAQGRLVAEATEACTRGAASQWMTDLKRRLTKSPAAQPGTGEGISLSWLLPALLLAALAWWLRPRAIIKVTGMIETLGESIKKPGGDKRYDYISVVRRDGGSTMIRKVHVPDEIDRILRVGVDGVFLVQKVFATRRLVAVRAGERHAVAQAYTWSPPGFYLRLVLGGLLMVGSLAVLGLVLMLTIIGLLLVPLIWGMAVIFAAMLVYVAVFYPMWRAQLRAELRTEGMDKLPGTVEI